MRSVLIAGHERAEVLAVGVVANDRLLFLVDDDAVARSTAPTRGRNLLDRPRRLGRRLRHRDRHRRHALGVQRRLRARTRRGSASSTKNADGSCAATVDGQRRLSASNTAMPLLWPSSKRFSGSICHADHVIEIGALVADEPAAERERRLPFGARTWRRYRIELMLSAASASRLAGIIWRTRCTSGSAAARAIGLHEAIAGGEIRARRPRRTGIRRGHAAIPHQRLVVTAHQPQRFAGVKPRGGHRVVAGEQPLDALEAGHRGSRHRDARAALRHRDAAADDVAPSARSRYPDRPSAADRPPIAPTPRSLRDVDLIERDLQQRVVGDLAAAGTNR